MSWSHGYSGYSNHGCRCDVCRQGNTDYWRVRSHVTGRHRPREQYLAERYPEPPPHGTVARYSKRWKCRCDECRTVASAARRAARAKVTA